MRSPLLLLQQVIKQRVGKVPAHTARRGLTERADGGLVKWVIHCFAVVEQFYTAKDV